MVLCLSSKKCGKEGHKRFIVNHFGGRSPWSDDEIRERFKAYVYCSSRIRMFFDSGHVEKVWSAALQGFPDVDMFQLRRRRFDAYENERVENPGCKVYLHPHDEAHDAAACAKGVALVCDKVFIAALGSLHALDRKIRELAVSCVFSGDFDWLSTRKWNDIKLNGIERLTIDSDCTYEKKPFPSLPLHIEYFPPSSSDLHASAVNM